MNSDKEKIRAMIEKLCYRIDQPLVAKENANVGDWFLEFGYTQVFIWEKVDKEAHVKECRLKFVMDIAAVESGLNTADFFLTEYNNNM